MPFFYIEYRKYIGGDKMVLGEAYRMPLWANETGRGNVLYDDVDKYDNGYFNRNELSFAVGSLKRIGCSEKEIRGFLTQCGKEKIPLRPAVNFYTRMPSIQHEDKLDLLPIVKDGPQYGITPDLVAEVIEAAGDVALGLYIIHRKVYFERIGQHYDPIAIARYVRRLPLEKKFELHLGIVEHLHLKKRPKNRKPRMESFPEEKQATHPLGLSSLEDVFHLADGIGQRF